MMYAACLLGIGIGIGGSIQLYRIVRQWLHDGDESPSPAAAAGVSVSAELDKDSDSNDNKPGIHSEQQVNF